VLDGAERLASGVIDEVEQLDRLVREAAEHWRLDRIGLVERNILRLGILELRAHEVSPKTAIDEAVTLAHWFGGPRTPAFVNGVLDRIARSLGRL
jgi:N utilization substance protein B